MIKTNADQLVEVCVLGQIPHPEAADAPPRVAYDGIPFLPVGQSGITINVKVGDPAFGWAWGDHVEPGVSISQSSPGARVGMCLLSAIGNEATVISAAMDGKDVKLKGVTGVVTGKLGRAGRVLIHFPRRLVERLTIGDQIQVRAVGTGLRMTDYPDVGVFNTSPRLFKAINATEKGGKIRIPVAKIIPGKLMGSGVGSGSAHSSDYDLQSASAEAVKDYDLESIRLGDLVAVTDYDATYGPRYQERAITVGAIVHGASRLPGHGPGVCVLFTSATGRIEPIITRKANLAELLQLP